ncbi:MAG: hypothetical protein ABH851_09550 [Methanobacteriota archaeon]
MVQSFINKNEDLFYHKNHERNQVVEMYGLAFMGFLIPFLTGHPQLLVGVCVNALIIRSALSMSTARALPVLVTPSLGALARGIIFGPYTVYLVYLIPFIWTGNFILFQAFRYRLLKKWSYPQTILGGAALKAGFLFSSAYLLYSIDLIPKVFLTVMGAMQFTTAIIAGISVYLMSRSE